MNGGYEDGGLDGVEEKAGKWGHFARRSKKTRTKERRRLFSIDSSLARKKKADTRNGCEQPPARPPDRTRESGGVVREAGAPRTAESAKSKRATEGPIVP